MHLLTYFNIFPAASLPVNVARLVISHMDDCLVRLNSRWTQGLRALRDKFNEFHKLIDGYGVSTTICTEFFNLYISGVPSNALDQFLNTSLNIGVAIVFLKRLKIVALKLSTTACVTL